MSILQIPTFSFGPTVAFLVHQHGHDYLPNNVPRTTTRQKSRGSCIIASEFCDKHVRSRHSTSLFARLNPNVFGLFIGKKSLKLLSRLFGYRYSLSLHFFTWGNLLWTGWDSELNGSAHDLSESVNRTTSWEWLPNRPAPYLHLFCFGILTRGLAGRKVFFLSSFCFNLFPNLRWWERRIIVILNLFTGFFVDASS